MHLTQRHTKHRGRIAQWMTLIAQGKGITAIAAGGFDPSPPMLTRD